jgi:hypothetical protein
MPISAVCGYCCCCLEEEKKEKKRVVELSESTTGRRVEVEVGGKSERRGRVANQVEALRLARYLCRLLAKNARIALIMTCKHIKRYKNSSVSQIGFYFEFNSVSICSERIVFEIVLAESRVIFFHYHHPLHILRSKDQVKTAAPKATEKGIQQLEKVQRQLHLGGDATPFLHIHIQDQKKHLGCSPSLSSQQHELFFSIRFRPIISLSSSSFGTCQS